MNAGLLLRVGIYVIGVWALFSGATTAVYYGHAWFTGNVVSEVLSTPASLFGYCIVPFVFALACFSFAGRVSKALLGAHAETPAVAPASAETLLRVAVKLIALYLFGTYVGPLVATGYELIGVRVGQRLSEFQVESDLIANLTGCAFAALLWFQTGRVVALFREGPR